MRRVVRLTRRRATTTSTWRSRVAWPRCRQWLARNPIVVQIAREEDTARCPSTIRAGTREASEVPFFFFFFFFPPRSAPATTTRGAGLREKRLNESSRSAGSVAGPELVYAAEKLIRRRWTVPRHRTNIRWKSEISPGETHPPLEEEERVRERERQKNRETELHRWTVTLFRDRDPKCARDTRAGINKYTRSRLSDCVLCM